MKNGDKLLLGTACFLGGVVAGFLIAPIKKGMYFGNNCGNNFKNAEQLKKIIETSVKAVSDDVESEE